MTAKALSILLIKERVSVDELFAFLTAQNLTYLLPEILAELKKVKEANEKEEELAIETPFPLDEEALRAITALVIDKGEAPRTRVTENKELLFGFRAQHKGMLYDASAQRIIRELTK